MASAIMTHVHSLGGEHIKTIATNEQQSPNHIMRELERHTGVPQEFQRLVLEHQILTAESSLGDQGVRSDVTLLHMAMSPQPERWEAELSKQSPDAGMVKYLLRAGAEPMRPLRCGKLPLAMAIRSDANTVAALLEARADPDCTTPTGQNDDAPLLEVVARMGDEAILAALLEAGADPRRANTFGATALHWAAHHGWEGCLRILLECRADPQQCARSGSSPLHWAAAAGQPASVRTLLEARADPQQRNRYRLTALDDARQRLSERHCANCAVMLEEATGAWARD